MAKPDALMKSSDKMNHDLGKLITVYSTGKFFLFLITELPYVLAMKT